MFWPPPTMWRRGIAACAFMTALYGCSTTSPVTTPSPDPAGPRRMQSSTLDTDAAASGPRTATSEPPARKPSTALEKTSAHTSRDKSKIGVRTSRDDKPHLHRDTPAPPLPTERELLKVADDAMAHVFPPLASAATTGAGAPVAVMLHGMCGAPLNACTRWRDTPQQHGWLLCPSGNTGCGGRFDWSGDGEDKARHIDAALTALRERHGAHVAEAGSDVLMGFSRGAFVARDVAYARPGRYRGLVLIGAALKPDAQRLRRSGIRRVVLASGDLDGARPTMQLAAGLLRRDGMPARFISLGRVWHTLPHDLHERLREPLAWVAAAPEED